MDRIHVVSGDEGIRYRVFLTEEHYNHMRMGPDMPMNNWRALHIAVRLVGAKMSEWQVLRSSPNGFGSSEEKEAFLPCNAGTTKALLATGFDWDEEARSHADRFQVSLSEVDQLRKESARLHREFWTKLSELFSSSDGRPAPVPPW